MKIYDVEESDLLGLCDLLTMDEMNNGTGSPEIMVEDFIVGTQKLRVCPMTYADTVQTRNGLSCTLSLSLSQGQAKSKDLFELRTRLSAMERNQLNLMEEMARLRSTLRWVKKVNTQHTRAHSLRQTDRQRRRDTLPRSPVAPGAAPRPLSTTSSAPLSASTTHTRHDPPSAPQKAARHSQPDRQPPPTRPSTPSGSSTRTAPTASASQLAWARRSRRRAWFGVGACAVGCSALWWVRVSRCGGRWRPTTTMKRWTRGWPRTAYGPK